MLVAVAVAGVPYVWALWDLWMSSINPLQSGTPDALSRSAYDVQARAMMSGHFALPNGSIGPEAFVHDGHQFTYFGIFPSLLRMPVFLFTHALDGRLTAVSMLGAWLVTALFGALLLWRIRIVLRGEASLGWAETTSYGILLASLLAGTVLLYLASQPNEYSEDLVWSVALASASLFALLGVVERPTWGRIVACGTLVLLTNLNRATTGYACIIAALVIAVWFGLGRAGPDRRQWWIPMLLAGLVPMAAGIAIDLAKFGIPFGVPVSAQFLFKSGGYIHINGGHYYSLRFVPSALQAYADPTNLRFTSLFPYITLPNIPIYPIAHTRLFTRAPTASVIATTPLLVVAGIWGVITSFTRQQDIVKRSLRILLIAMAGTAGSAMIDGWILERFVGDFLPLLMLAGMIGTVDVWRRLAGKGRRIRVVTVAALSVLALFGAAANLGLAVTPATDWTQGQLVRYVEAQRAFSDITGHPLSHDVVRGDSYPRSAPMGQLFIKGRCDALYVADQAPPTGLYLPNLIWLQVERAPRTPVCRSLIGSATKMRSTALSTSIVAPARGATVAGSHVAVVVSAAGKTKAVSVRIILIRTPKNSGAVLGEATYTHSEWTYSWDSLDVPDGTYDLRSLATSTSGTTVLSPGYPVIVDNQPSGP
jgi:hypothetical protein